MESTSRVTFLAFEPWETQLAAGFLDHYHRHSNGEVANLVVTDPYQIRNTRSKKRLERIQESKSFETFVVFRDLLDWNSRIKEPDSEWSAEILSDLATRIGTENVRRAINSDVYLNPMERSPYYPPLSDAQKAMAAALVVERCMRIFDDILPKQIIMIDDQYLPKYIFALLAEKEGTPVKVFRHSRFEDLIICNDFFLPSAQNYVRMLPNRPKQTHALDRSLYAGSKASSDKPGLQEARRKPLGATARLVRESLREQKHKLRRGNKTRPAGWRRTLFLVSTNWRVHLYALAGSARSIRYAWCKWPFKAKSDLPEDYVLVPLHYRPESAVMTQGYGITDEQMVGAVAACLEDSSNHIKCVALENPSMVSDRRRSFYRKLLKRHQNLIFADPAENTLGLLKKSLGVVTISGTLGLEAGLLGKPVHVLGRPEYLEAIQSSGLEQLSDFITALCNGTASTSYDSTLSYLQKIEKAGTRGQLGWPSVASDEILNETVQMLWGLYAPS